MPVHTPGPGTGDGFYNNYFLFRNICKWCLLTHRSTWRRGSKWSRNVTKNNTGLSDWNEKVTLFIPCQPSFLVFWIRILSSKYSHLWNSTTQRTARKWSQVPACKLAHVHASVLKGEVYPEMKLCGLLVLVHCIHLPLIFFPVPPLDRVLTSIPLWCLIVVTSLTQQWLETLLRFEVFWTFLEMYSCDRSRLPVCLSSPYYACLVKIWRAILPWKLI